MQEPEAIGDSVQVSIVIPAYNEEAAIGADLDSIREAMDASPYSYEVIVVDDGSRDRTAEVVRERPWVRLLQHPQNRGTGAARNTGTQAARGEVVGMTDGDGTYPVRDFPQMFATLIEGNHDMVIGARRREAGTVRLLRSSAKWFIRKLACYLTQTDIPDLNSGMRAFRKEVWQEFRNILPNTHSWVSTITIAALSNGMSVAFMPIDYFPRKGRSSFHPIRDTYNYISLVVRSVMYFNPLRIFLPATLVLFVIAVVKLLRDFIVYRSFYVPAITLMIFLTAIQIGALGLLADLIVRKTR
ncbi:MAG: glycosyltransferase family 2 protein [Anaerolineae bacterium]|nr:glycosyltransferase family 2 protein [Anaerolineae bacterium]